MQNLNVCMNYSRKTVPGILYRLIFSFSCILLSMGVKAQAGIVFTENEKWEHVLRQAKLQDKPIFMDCYTSWCGPCKALAKDIFTQKEVGDFFNAHFVNVKYDMEKGEGKLLKKKYESYVVAYPTLLLIDKEGNVIQQLVGYQEVDQLLKGVKDGMEGRSVFNYRKVYEGGNRDLPFLKAYVDALENALFKEEARKVAVDYMNLIPVEKLKEKEVWELVKPYLDDPFTPQFEFVLYNLVNYWHTLGEDRYALERQMRTAIRTGVEQIIGKRWDESGQLLPLTNEPEKVEKLRKFMLREAFPNAESQRLKLRIHELKLEQKWEDVYNYLVVCRDAGVLVYDDYYINETIEYLAQHATDTTLLSKCLILMEKLQALAERETKRLFKVNFYGTLALLHGKLEHEQEARECAAKDEELKKETRAIYERVTKHE